MHAPAPAVPGCSLTQAPFRPGISISPLRPRLRPTRSGQSPSRPTAPCLHNHPLFCRLAWIEAAFRNIQQD